MANVEADVLSPEDRFPGLAVAAVQRLAAVGFVAQRNHHCPRTGADCRSFTEALLEMKRIVAEFEEEGGMTLEEELGIGSPDC